MIIANLLISCEPCKINKILFIYLLLYKASESGFTNLDAMTTYGLNSEILKSKKINYIF